MRIEFRRATGNVNHWNVSLRQPFQNALHGFLRHHFAARRASIDVAMHAGLIAFFADIDLQNLRLCTLQTQAMLGAKKRNDSLKTF